MTPEPPDVLALELPWAQALLQAAGWTVTVRTTAPPRKGDGAGTPRVLRQRLLAPGEIELVVACPRFERAPAGD